MFTDIGSLPMSLIDGLRKKVSDERNATSMSSYKNRKR